MKKTIKVFPQEKYAENFFNIKPASDFIPEWYRKSPSNVVGTSSELIYGNASTTTSTYKKCTPFYDALTSGYMIFLSADIEILRGDNNTAYFQWRTERDIITFHDNVQWEGLVPPKGYSQFVFKWHNQFTFTTPTGYSTLFVSPANRFDLPFQTVTGIVDTDIYDIAIHFPFFIRDDFSGIISKGTPITQMIPIKRDAWNLELNNYDEEKVHISMQKFRNTIKRSYKNNYWFRKEYK